MLTSEIQHARVEIRSDNRDRGVEVPAEFARRDAGTAGDLEDRAVRDHLAHPSCEVSRRELEEKRPEACVVDGRDGS